MFDNYYYYDAWYGNDYNKDLTEKISEKSDLWEADTKSLPEDVWLDGKDKFGCNIILKHKFMNYNDDNSQIILFGLGNLGESNQKTRRRNSPNLKLTKLLNNAFLYQPRNNNLNKLNHRELNDKE